MLIESHQTPHELKVMFDTESDCVDVVYYGQDPLVIQTCMIGVSPQFVLIPNMRDVTPEKFKQMFAVARRPIQVVKMQKVDESLFLEYKMASPHVKKIVFASHCHSR